VRDELKGTRHKRLKLRAVAKNKHKSQFNI